jgi:hypothetical protein
MSRTYRRKGYEQTQNGSWGRLFRKTNGYYTKVDHLYFLDEETDSWSYQISARIPTKWELWKEVRWAHGDDHQGSRSPNWWYRHHRMKENRNINNRELHKWITRVDYEPMFEDNPRDCSWDWR